MFLRQRLKDKKGAGIVGNFAEIKKKRGLPLFFFLTLLIVLWAGGAWAVVREGGIPGQPGLSFHRLTYYWSYVDMNISNSTKRNVILGGQMVFLDRHMKPIARAEILRTQFKRYSTRKLRARFIEGTGEEASKAMHLFWDFNQRNR